MPTLDKQRRRVGAMMFVTAAVVATLGSGSPAAAEIKNPAVRQAVIDALQSCDEARNNVTYYSAEVQDSDYVTWTIKRDYVNKTDPSAKADTTKLVSAGTWVPATDWPKCEKIFSDYETGVGAAGKTVSDVCASNLRAQLSQINFPLGRGSMYARQYLVTLQYMMTHGKVGGVENEKGEKSQDFGRCGPNEHFKKGWAEWEKTLKEMTDKVVALEASKGFKFVRIANVPGPSGALSFHYIDLKTNQEVQLSNLDNLPKSSPTAPAASSSAPPGGQHGAPPGDAKGRPSRSGQGRAR